ncbi:MAG: DUF1007 family protein [Alphaproteobacteria bacterium]|nr:DUF1007 family protein [Rhizobiaceae bacterium]MBU3962016.1 DUF1007 family protein [Alphaproteobacteria bacterium]MBU4048085.1 DUF1007 family protein [Alphaproteobacteria bacterium]MBU4091423.1 DUF1007 family protein [Alphaproteobacteria bacterium]MBU4159020.1 DUF1007 family protein [Alphaproteobacteria bacterium]
MKTFRVLSRLLALSLLSCAAPVAAWAHPDIAITARLLFDVQAGRLTMIAESFAFDAAHSRRLLALYDANTDGRFDETEMAALGRSLAEDLEPLGYFTEMRQAGRAVPLPAPAAFHATSEAGIVTVTLGFRLDAPLDVSEGRSVEIVLRDRDYTAAFRLTEATPVILRGGEGACGYRLQDRPDLAYFGGLVVPQAITLSCR